MVRWIHPTARPGASWGNWSHRRKTTEKDIKDVVAKLAPLSTLTSTSGFSVMKAVELMTPATDCSSRVVAHQPRLSCRIYGLRCLRRLRVAKHGTTLTQDPTQESRSWLTLASRLTHQTTHASAWHTSRSLLKRKELTNEYRRTAIFVVAVMLLLTFLLCLVVVSDALTES